MARMHVWVGLLLLSSAVGCVSTERYNAARMDADQYAQRLAAAERAKDEARASADAYKQQLDNLNLTGDQKNALVLNQQQQISELQRQLAELNARYDDAVKRVGSAVVLDPTTNSALTEFARANPDLVDFDSARGIVKFKSDVTFSAGSAVLTPTAQNAIDRFASILNSPSAAGYELMVVGHTDNQRVSHEATIKAGHKDNWYLSAHRAISVSEELQKKGVSPGRLEVAGYADQRPIASNSTPQGQQQNRRVEVLILPTTVHNAVAAAPAPARNGTHKAPKSNAFNKDVADTEVQKPAFNK